MQIGLFGLTFGHRKFRNQDFAQLNRDVTAIGDRPGIANKLGVIFAPSLNNLLGIGNVQLKVSQAHAFFIAEERAGLHAQQNLVCNLVLVFQIVRVASDDTL